VGVSTLLFIFVLVVVDALVELVVFDELPPPQPNIKARANAAAPVISLIRTFYLSSHLVILNLSLRKPFQDGKQCASSERNPTLLI